MSASVEIYIGGAGVGKSTRLYTELVDLAYRNPGKKYYLIVPEQAGSSMEQRILSLNKERTGRNGFFNIDIIGFTRLAYRVFEEQGRSMKQVMEEYGKTILLRSVVARMKSSLSLYQGSVERQGFIDELKSLFSEFMLFDIQPEDLDKAVENLGEADFQLRNKLKDVLAIYKAFREDPVFRRDYMVAEELPVYLARLLSESAEVKCVDGATFIFDGFTGFTAEQRKALEEIVKRAENVRFAVTIEPEEMQDPLFGQSKETLEQLISIVPSAKVIPVRNITENASYDGKPAEAKEDSANSCGESMIKTDSGRESDRNPLQVLTQNVFRFPGKEYNEPLEGRIQIRQAENPVEELALVAEDIRRRVQKHEIRYRDAAILTADISGLSAYADSIMREYEIPYFSDQNRSFINNPIIDAQLSVLEILDRDFSYESVFAFLKTGILDRAEMLSDRSKTSQKGPGVDSENDISIEPAGQETADNDEEKNKSVIPGSAASTKRKKLRPDVAEWIYHRRLELLENFVIAHGIRGRKLWEKEVFHFTGGRELSKTEKKQLEEIDELRKLFLDVLKPVLRFGGKKEYPVSKMISALIALAEDPHLHLSDRGDISGDDLLSLGYPAEARAYPGIQEKYLSVLEKTAAILGEQEMTLHDLRETLTIGVREIKVGVIPPTLDAVLIGDLERTRFGGCKVLYIVNMNEGILPHPKGQGSILSDMDRVRLAGALMEKNLAPDETEKRFREQFSLYLAISKAKEALILSFSKKNRGKGDMEPSFLLGRIRRVLPGLVVEKKSIMPVSGTPGPDRMEYIRLIRKEKDEVLTAEEQERKRILSEVFPDISTEEDGERQGAEHLPDELTSSLNLSLSISQLEKYAKCPYEWFLLYVLRLRERRVHAMSDMDLGNIMHYVMKEVFTRVKEEHNNDWKNLSADVLGTLVKEAVAAAILLEKPSLKEEDLKDGKTGIILSEMEELALRTMEMQKFQLMESSMLPELFEATFEAEFTVKGTSGEREIKLLGIIDRLDSYKGEEGTTYIRILDYKTGDRKLDLTEVQDGRSLQLPMYLRILTEIFRANGGTVPAGMYYYHVDRPVLEKLNSKAATPEAAAEQETENALKLRGLPNVGPFSEEEKIPKHFILEIQEKGTVSADRKLNKGKVLPIDVTKEHELKSNILTATTDDLLGLGDYSLYEMHRLAERLLSGQVEKHPTRVAGAEKGSCDYCSGRDVCRFKGEESPERYVRPAGDKAALMEMLVNIGKTNPTKIENAKMKDGLPKEARKDETEDAQEEDGVDEG